MIQTPFIQDHIRHKSLYNPVPVLQLVDSCTFAPFRRAQPRLRTSVCSASTKVNLHKKFLVGVGLPLFHQSLGKSGRPLGCGGSLGLTELSACCYLVVEQQACESEHDHILEKFKSVLQLN